MIGARRFSQAISEGDGISVIVDVLDAGSALAAERQGAEALVARHRDEALRGATELPILWRGEGPLAAAADAGADACLLVVADYEDEPEELERLYAEAVSELGLDCVVEVRSAEELELALERLDPEIFLLSAAERASQENPLESALQLLPDVPAGKLAVAEAAVSTREQVDELERAGVDAVIVGARDVAELVSRAAPEV